MSTVRIRPPSDPSSLRASDSPLELDRDSLAPRIAWAAVFGNDRPVELEIGCGKGLFLRNAAAAHPDVNWFGLERSSKHLRRAIDRVVKAGLDNVRFVKALAEEFLDEWAPDGGLRAVHILYPDPWPKKRHHRRRLLGRERGGATVRSLARVIAPGGSLSVATDHTGYAEVIEETVGACPEFERMDHFHSQTLLPDPDAPITEFERKYRAEGRPHHLFSWRRRPGDSVVSG
jgi:tRNA (guanine-N7-)-methyltransferase